MYLLGFIQNISGENNRYFILRYDLCVNIHIYFVNSESSEQVECAIFITLLTLRIVFMSISVLTKGIRVYSFVFVFVV